MWRFLKSPLVRISFGLAMLTVAMLLVTDLLGLVPDTKNAQLQSRKIIAESLAVQLSTDLADRQIHSVEETMRAVVERNEALLSGAIRIEEGGLIGEFGGHEKHWTLQPEERSTPTQVQVPIYNNHGHWGTVELSFKPLAESGELFSSHSSFLAVTLFMGLVGFIAYLLFLKRTMRELNPDAVIPERVRKALDTLAEGLLIVDQKGYIVFSNAAFARKTGLTPKQLVGKESAALDWDMGLSDVADDKLPWFSVLEGKTLPKGITVRLKTGIKTTYTFAVNASPITASADKIRGALITFDDITEIEAKNAELCRTLNKLEKSQREITRQNQELQVLATRDPLTNTLNRRSLFQGFETLFTEAQEGSEELSCIMVDIDHFKLVNDRFGHAVGDKVIKLLANILTEHSRPNDLVGRFGGEEFCVVLPGVGIKVAASIAERMRLAIQEGEGAKFTSVLRITSSFGVSTLSSRVENHAELLEQADQALYTAKEGGRNRVVSWSSALEDETSEGDSKPPQSAPALDDIEVSTNGQSGQEETLDKVQHPIHQDPEQDSKVVKLYPQNMHLQQSQDAQSDTLGDSCLPSRMLLFDRIGQAINRARRYDTQVALLVINVEALQRVNHTLGLAAGEKFAKIVVSRFKQLLRRTDTVVLTDEDELLFSISRLGSDEIVILLTDLKQNEIVTTIMQRILSVHSEPVELEGSEFYLNTNMGVSLFPSDGEDPDVLVRNASSAMREAKQSPGRNNFRFYADDINQSSKKQIRLESELHRALERDELIVYYQPKVDLRTGKILGMEALIRWQHPQLGLVPPNDFIPLAEQTGLIEEISQWVIRTVCGQIRFWEKAGYGNVTIAVNLSPLEFRNPEMGDNVINLVDEYGIPASAIELEITETVVMQNMETAVSILEKLHHAGFGISVDDFGTGYSSLSYLKRFPLSKVKIDRSFISDFTQGKNDAALVSAIIAMSHSLDLRVVAEGVETEEQLRFLQDLHCDEIQGFLISKPIPSEEAGDLLAQSSSIQRLIMDYGVNYAELTAQQGMSSVSGMIGILNDFPQKVG